MAFFVIIIALLFAYALPATLLALVWNTFDRYRLWFIKICGVAPVWTLLLLMASVLLPLLCVQWLWADFLWGVPSFCLSVVVLWACLGPMGLREELAHCHTLVAQGADEAFARYAKEQFHYPLSLSKDHPGCVWMGLVLWVLLTRWFAVALYVVLLGPFGALLYRLCDRLMASEPVEAQVAWLDLLFGVLHWLPIRVLGVCFALVGRFSSTWSLWCARFRAPLQQQASLLVAYGQAAWDDAQPDRAQDVASFDTMMGSLFALLKRAMLLCLFVLALCLLLM
jgi:AmpE protein